MDIIFEKSLKANEQFVNNMSQDELKDFFKEFDDYESGGIEFGIDELSDVIVGL